MTFLPVFVIELGSRDVFAGRPFVLAKGERYDGGKHVHSGHATLCVLGSFKVSVDGEPDRIVGEWEWFVVPKDREHSFIALEDTRWVCGFFPPADFAGDVRGLTLEA